MAASAKSSVTLIVPTETTLYIACTRPHASAFEVNCKLPRTDTRLEKAENVPSPDQTQKCTVKQGRQCTDQTGSPVPEHWRRPILYTVFYTSKTPSEDKLTSPEKYFSVRTGKAA